MKADFLDAHKRHWHDAELLFETQRLANADHLYGMAAECGLKRLMRYFGMPYDEARDRPSQGKDRVHANDIWERYESYRKGHQQGPGYALPADNPFSDWEADQRYAHRSFFEPARVTAHRHGAKMVLQLINNALRDGLL